jgi:Domain of unknown function (DUF4401)
MNWVTFTARLHQMGLLADSNITDSAPTQESGAGRWLSIVGAWLAAVLLIGFVGALTGRFLEAPMFCIAAGSCLILCGIVIERSARLNTSAMKEQFCLIACLLGGLLLSRGVFLALSYKFGFLVLAILSLACLLCARGPNQRLIFATAGIGFLCALFARYQLTFYIWLILLAATTALCFQQARWVASKQGELFNALILATSIGALVSPFLLFKSLRLVGVLDVVGESATFKGFNDSDLTWAALGVLSCLAIAAAGYFTGLKVLRKLSLSGILVYGYFFYYSVGSTLLDKAYALLATGVALLLIRLWTSNKAQGESL